MFASSLSHDGAQTRYSFRDTSHKKHPDYLYMSDNATAPSSDDLSDEQPTLNKVTTAAGIHKPKGSTKQEELLHLEQLSPSQSSGASHIVAHPLISGYDSPPLQEFNQKFGKPKKKVGRPLKYEEAADSPNMTEAEKRKLRRRTANRESARRVRDRRTQHSGNLEAKVAAVAATHDQLAQRIAHVEGERHLASSLCQTFHSRLSALQQNNEGLALEVIHLEQSLEKGVPLIDARSAALTIGDGKSHGWGVASAAESNNVDLPASQPISRPVEKIAPSSAWQPRHVQQSSQSSHSPQDCSLTPTSSSALVLSTPDGVMKAPISALPASLQPLASQTKDDMTVVLSTAVGPSAFAFAPADTAEPLDVMLTLLDSDAPAASMRRQTSLTLSRGLSAMLDLFYNHGKEGQEIRV
ncbi:hypothetical protein WJX79_009455 [Trebouxia sp. C0005]